jgi:outer membrane protein assembly factor BamB
MPGKVAAPLSQFASGLIVPLQLGQVFYIDPLDGRSMATPFQPRIVPNQKFAYQPARQVDEAGLEFVITDGDEKIYRVELESDPSPHLTLAAEASVGAHPIISPLVVNGSSVFAVTEGQQLARFQLPSLENVGQTSLSAEVVWGPYRIAELILVATTEEQLLAVDTSGSIAWTTSLSGGDLAGPPLESEGRVLIAYCSGLLESRSMADGGATAAVDLLQPLGSGPVRFMGRVVLATHDGSLLVVNEP